MAIDPIYGMTVGGNVNGSGGFVMRAERVGNDALLGQVVNMVAEAQRSGDTMWKIRQNLMFAFLYNAQGILVASHQS